MLSMLNLLSIAKPFITAYRIPLLLPICQNIIVAYRTYSTKISAAEIAWGKVDEEMGSMGSLDSMLLLIEAQKYDELLRALNEAPTLTPYVCAQVIQAKFGKYFGYRREIELKEKIMEIMRERDIVPDSNSITPLISLYGKSGELNKANALLEMMKERGIARSVSTYSSLMKCYGKDAAKVSDLYDQMIDDGARPNVYIYTTMIDAYSKSGNLQKAIEVFDSMKKDGIKPNVFTYTTMIDAFVKSGRIKKAIEVFDSMKKDEVKPDVNTYTTIIDAYAKSGNIEKAIEYFTIMKRDEIRPRVTIFESLFKCAAKSGKYMFEMMYILKEAKRFSAELDIHSWNNIMAGLSRAEGEEDQRKALSIWKYISGAVSHDSLGIDLPIKAKYVLPSTETISIAFEVCKKGAFEKEAHEIWMFGQESEIIEISQRLFSSYLNCLISFGEKGADRAFDLILSGMRGKKMPLRFVKPDKKTIGLAEIWLVRHGYKKHAAKLRSFKMKRYSTVESGKLEKEEKNT
jgi:pentatricopeptide repeat protein